jgi:hypothetical protein
MCRKHPAYQHADNVRAIENIRDYGIPIREDHEVVAEYTDGMSLIPWARSLNVAAALAHDPDYIFIIDDDVWFRKEDIASAIESKLPIVGLPVMLKTQDIRTRTMNYAVFPGDPFIDLEKDFRHIPRIGTGALLVKAEVFHALKKTRPWFHADGYAKMRPDLPKIQENVYDYFPCGVQDVDGKPRYVGEDYGFCIEANKVGYPTYQHNFSMTAHMILGEPDGYLCDMLQMRRMAAEGKMVEGEVHAI